MMIESNLDPHVLVCKMRKSINTVNSILNTTYKIIMPINRKSNHFTP